MIGTSLLIPVVERQIWPDSPLAKIVDVLNYAVAEFNQGKISKTWREHLQSYMQMNQLDKIRSNDPETLGQQFQMGFGGSHFWVHDMTGEMAYIIYAPERNDEGWLRI